MHWKILSSLSHGLWGFLNLWAVWVPPSCKAIGVLALVHAPKLLEEHFPSKCLSTIDAIPR